MQMGIVEMVVKAGPLCAGADFRLPHAEPLVCNSAGIADSIRDRILEKWLRAKSVARQTLPADVRNNTRRRFNRCFRVRKDTSIDVSNRFHRK
jgi:hypothetical protein